MPRKVRKGEVHVTDHAVVRYLERYMGIDVDHIKDLILANGRREMVRSLRSGRFPIDSGAKIVAKDGVVITIVKRSTP